MAIDLGGRTAVVTSGMHDCGRAIAQRLLDAGANVMLACADEKGEEMALDGDPDRWGRFHVTAMDKLAIANLLAAVAERFQRVDILVNAAQEPRTLGAFLDLDNEAFDTAVATHVSTVFQLSQAVARRMIQQREKDPDAPPGAIVNISSISARRTVPQLLTYSVSSAALDQLTRSMAASLAEYGIRVNAIALGGVLTERLRAAFRDNDGLRDEMISVTPMGRLAEIEEAADATVFAASDQASYITGQVIAVDGGRTLLDPMASPVRS